MLGRNFTQDELDHARSEIVDQLAAYEVLAATVTDPAGLAALDVFSPSFFNAMLLALDRPFVHRLHLVTGTDGNALNEVEVLVDSLINHGGILQPSTELALDPATSVTGIAFGERIRLTVDQFERLAAAFFVEIEKKFIIEAAAFD
ncbi:MULTISPECIES: hypothetical protein [unclassified Leifsonia]|uniref:hypothetical protein n=1 Tax=unclassified Leifsonia TaxID=2663824 RepID=UPI000701962F|nr:MULTISPECIES: hypothetical protein [unclassified Leifsonia]KQX06998.1 hypothetical protein ASC59_04090 [Leifsonia sp. Root1293]KRA11281.1 hypothetical protein ASD61_04090 [Leifsonia sp. Root60]